ncbi:MAG: acetyl/propionyl/methylcrotonyl-CoA carboxylase subunit alpha [Legionellales bacterium]|nr:acetyl/propionyl/methylcrotonyl-CoA carboxylase subunit alpha [Legionellales bacterium]
MFSTILIANRGEIACRIMRTAHRMGLRCIAVYSEADINAPHVKMADEAYCIGAAPARESYLRSDKILQAAIKAKAQAIHPGYGFLSENTDFAKQCEDAGIVFIGPPATAILAMGNKSEAKQLMQTAGVPLIPGYHGHDQSLDTFINAAETIGFPVLLKASAGGGGKGMRVVNSAKEMETALAGAKREALSSFGNDDMLLEKYLAKPRHVEIQLFSDQYDNHLYLCERDCSIQRRHQKIIEEAPAPGITDSLRTAMGDAAIACAKAIHYVGAGTIEFLLDEDGRFYFMEMNTRLQVEHPVTEMITGLDLVEWQLRIASGEKLPLTQQEVTAKGHAIEVRIYAEDPANQFLPSTGTLYYLDEPPEQPWLRIDTGVETGTQISQYYDPLIAKLIVWGETRSEAILRLLQALSHYRICGVQTNLTLLARIAAHPEYQAAHLLTHFIDVYHESLFLPPTSDVREFLIAAAIWQMQQYRAGYPTHTSPWYSGQAWRMNMAKEQFIDLKLGDKLHTIRLIQNTPSAYQIWLENRPLSKLAAVCQKQGAPERRTGAYTSVCEDASTRATQLLTSAVEFFDVKIISMQANRLVLSINQVQRSYTLVTHENQLVVFNELHCLTFESIQGNWDSAESEVNAGHLRSPMPGTITAVLVKQGQAVKRGEALLIVEAMKMEHTISATMDGVIESIYYQTGESVDEGAELVALK